MSLTEIRHIKSSDGSRAASDGPFWVFVPGWSRKLCRISRPKGRGTNFQLRITFQPVPPSKFFFS